MKLILIIILLNILNSLVQNKFTLNKTNYKEIKDRKLYLNKKKYYENIEDVMYYLRKFQYKLNNNVMNIRSIVQKFYIKVLHE